MKVKRIIFIGSVVLNLLFVVAFGYLVMERGGLPYVVTKVSATLGIGSSDVSENASPDYLKRQSLYELLSIREDSTVFLGDSITSGVEWSEVFQSTDYVNRGIPGDDSSGVLNRLDNIVDTNPSKLFIMIGVNDLHSDGDSSNLLDNYHAIIDQVQANSPDTDIYIQSILPYNTEKYAQADTTNMSNELIRNTNEELRLIAEGKEVSFIDLYPLMANENGELKSEYTFDGLHLSGEAYMVWKEELEKHLN